MGLSLVHWIFLNPEWSSKHGLEVVLVGQDLTVFKNKVDLLVNRNILIQKTENSTLHRHLYVVMSLLYLNYSFLCINPLIVCRTLRGLQIIRYRYISYLQNKRGVTFKGVSHRMEPDVPPILCSVSSRGWDSINVSTSNWFLSDLLLMKDIRYSFI